MNKKISSSVIFGIIVVILLGAFAALMYSRMDNSFSPTVTSSSTSSNLLDSTSTINQPEQISYVNARGGFSVSYPSTFSLSEGDITPTESWSFDATSTGELLATFTVPQSFEPQTNFADAKLTIGESKTKVALASCLTKGQGQKISINGNDFTSYHSVDAAAGNRYDTTIYRIIKNKTCYSIDSVIHYGVFENYDPSSGIKQFDMEKVQNLLNGVVQSFRFN